MTLNLSEQEMLVLEEYCKRKGMSKTAIMKQALRIYQIVEDRLANGEKIFFEDEEKKEKSELLIL